MENINSCKEIPRETRKSWRRRLHVNPKLIPLKVLVFLLNGANNALYPFFTIHMLDVGLTLTETGIIFILIPIAGCVGSPLIGSLADKLGNYKKVVVVLALLSVLSYGLLGFAVPRFADRIVTSPFNISDATVTLSCKDILFNLTSKFKPVPEEFVWQKTFLDRTKLSRCRSNCSDQRYCFESTTGTECLQHEKLEGLLVTNVSIPSFPVWNQAATYFAAVLSGRNATNVSRVYCKGAFQCSTICRLENPLSASHVGHKMVGKKWKTMAFYTVFRVIGSTLVSSVMQLLDASTLLMAKQHNGDFGVQRTFGLFGSLSMPVITGHLNDIATAAKGQFDYSPSFYLFCSMFALGAIITWFMDLEIKQPQRNVWGQVAKLMKNAKVASFVVAMFLVGCCFGALENYLFWFMKKFLHSPQWLLGMTNTVAGVSAIPVVAASTFIIRWFGHTKIFMASLLVYGVRFLAYSFVYDPYLILPVEILEAFTFSLTWVVATVYCGKLAPGYLATLQGIVGSMHYSMGRGFGALIAGILFDHFPARQVYQGIAATCFGLGLVYIVLYYTYLKWTPNPIAKERLSRSGSGEEDEKHSAPRNDDFQEVQKQEAEMELLHGAAIALNFGEENSVPLRRSSANSAKET